MMKKLLALMLSLLMLLSMTVVFTGCGDDNTKSKSKKSDKSTSDKDKDEDEDKDDEDKDDEDKDDEDKDDEDKDEDKTKSTKKTGNSNGDVTVEETVLVDQNGIKITSTGLEEDSFYGTVLNVLIENTSDKDVTVYSTATVVNGYAVSGYLFAEVSAGKKANEQFTLSAATLEAVGIETIGLIETSFRAYDDDYNTIVETDLISLKTSAYDQMDTPTAAEMGTELYNQNGVKICAQYYYDNEWSQGVLLVVENKTGKNIEISCDSLSANGFEITPNLSYEEIPKDKSLAYDMIIFESSLEDNNVDTIEELGMKFEFTDDDSFEPFLETGDLTLKVN